MNTPATKELTPQQTLKSKHGFTHAELLKGQAYVHDNVDGNVYLVKKDGYRGSVAICDGKVHEIRECVTSSKEVLKGYTKLYCELLYKTLNRPKPQS